MNKDTSDNSSSSLEEELNKEEKAISEKPYIEASIVLPAEAPLPEPLPGQYPLEFDFEIEKQRLELDRLQTENEVLKQDIGNRKTLLWTILGLCVFINLSTIGLIASAGYGATYPEGLLKQLVNGTLVTTVGYMGALIGYFWPSKKK